MLTKNEIKEQYDVNRIGIITTRGKFEGEPWYVVSLWDSVLNGCADREDFDGELLVASFRLDDEMWRFIHECDAGDPSDGDPREYIALYERSDGFVCHSFVMVYELDALVSDEESEAYE